MKRALAVVTVLAAGAGAPGQVRADDGAVTAFGALQEVGRSWQFEVVEGKSLAALAPVQDAPTSQCTVNNWAGAANVRGSLLVCVADPKAPANAPSAMAPMLQLIFDAQGVREIREPGELAAPTRLYAFTFPEVLPRPWQREARTPDGVRSQVAVREQTVAAGGRTVKAWLAVSTQTIKDQRGKAYALRGIAMYHPAYGPILLCTNLDDLGYHCLRRTQLEAKDKPGDPPKGGEGGEGGEVTKPAKPTAVISIAGKTGQDKSSLKPGAVAAKVTSAYVAGIRRCYRDLLRKKATAGGAVKLGFTVNAVGKTEDVTVAAFDPALAACVQPLIGAWRFPIPMSEYGEPRTARFTLDLKLTAE